MASADQRLYELKAEFPDGSITGIIRVLASSNASFAITELGEGELVMSLGEAQSKIMRLRDGAKGSHEKGHRPRFFFSRMRLTVISNRPDAVMLLTSKIFQQRYTPEQLHPLIMIAILKNSCNNC